MRVCSICKTSYSDKIDYCFVDGASLTQDDASTAINRVSSLTASQSSTDIFSIVNEDDDGPTEAFALPTVEGGGELPSVSDMIQMSSGKRRRRRRGRSKSNLSDLQNKTIIPESFDLEKLEEPQVLEHTAFFKRTETTQPESIDNVSDQTRDVTEPKVIGAPLDGVVSSDDISTGSDTDTLVIGEKSSDASQIPHDAYKPEKGMPEQTKAPIISVAKSPVVEHAVPQSEPVSPDFEEDPVVSDYPSEDSYDFAVEAPEAKKKWGSLYIGGALAFGLVLVGIFSLQGGPQNGPSSPPQDLVKSDKIEPIPQAVSKEMPPEAVQPEPVIEEPDNAVAVAEAAAVENTPENGEEEPEAVPPIATPPPPPPAQTAPPQAPPVAIQPQTAPEPQPATPPPPIAVTPPTPANTQSSSETAGSSSGQALEWGTQEPEAPSASRVSIDVNVAGAVVFVNDTRKGTAPLSITLPMGDTATIRVEKDGYTPSTKRVVPGQEEQSVQFILEQIAVEVETAPLQQVIFIKPIGLTVNVNGNSISIPQMTQLPIGIHTAKWTDSDGVAQQKTLRVGESSTPVRISLE